MKPAKQIVHWPEQDTPACEDHLQKLVGLAAICGFMLTWTPCEDTICKNCESEVRRAEPSDGSLVEKVEP